MEDLQLAKFTDKDGLPYSMYIQIIRIIEKKLPALTIEYSIDGVDYIEKYWLELIDTAREPMFAITKEHIGKAQEELSKQDADKNRNKIIFLDLLQQIMESNDYPKIWYPLFVF